MRAGPPLLLAAMLAACSGPASSASRSPSPSPRASSPPPLPTCLQVGDHMLTLLGPTMDTTGQRARAVRTIFLDRCERDTWAGDVRVCVLDTRSLDDPRQCKAKLTPAQRTALERDLATEQRMAARPGLPPACADYQATIAKVIACDKIPKSSRDALQQGFVAMTQAWTDLEDMPPEGRAAMEQGCTLGTDALIQAVAATCGW